MASTVKTANFKLNQWQGSDKPARADFNADNRIIDEALAAIRDSTAHFKVLGLYATPEELEAAHPAGTAGQAYAVGTALDNDLYIWDTVTGAWMSIGPVRGAAGDVVGPVSTADGAIALFDGTSGKQIKAASLGIDDLLGMLSNIEALQQEAQALKTGWIPLSGTVTYNSVDDPTGVINVPSGHGIEVGNRVRLSNASKVIYGIVTVVTATTVTFLHEINPSNSQALNLLVDSAVTDVYISRAKLPSGFPADPRRWTVKVTESATNQVASSPYENYQRVGTVGLTVPVGAWKIWGKFEAQLFANSTTDLYFNVSLSTSTSEETHPELTRAIYFADNTTNNKNIISNYTAEAQLYLSAKAEFFPIMKSPTASINICQINTIVSQLIISATCAYL